MPAKRPALSFRLPSLFMMLMICSLRRWPTWDSGQGPLPWHDSAEQCVKCLY